MRNDPDQQVDQEENFSEEEASNQEEISSSAELLQLVREKTSEENANQIKLSADDDDENEDFVLVKQSTENELMIVDESMIDIEMKNDRNENESSNELISKENNVLILDYLRPKVRHDYKKLHEKDFATKTKGFTKSAKKIPQIDVHKLKTSKTFKQVINEPQTKK